MHRALASILRAAFLFLLVALPSGRAHAGGELSARTADGSPATLNLVSEQLSITIEDQHAHTLLRQAYASGARERLEGQYLLSAGEAARVSGFAYWNGEQKIVGEVFEKDTATQIYEEVTGLGRAPGLLEEVPKTVDDGVYKVRVVIVEADGAVRAAEVAYTIDSNAPEFEVELDVRADGVWITVTGQEDLRSVVLAPANAPGRRVMLRDTGDHRRFEGLMPELDGDTAVKIVVADRARNEAARTVDAEGSR